MPMGRVIVFLGAPGSGKGTQSLRLAGELGIACLSTGEVLRAEAKRNSPSGLRLRRWLASGSLVSDDVVCNVVASRLEREIPVDGPIWEGLILDGFPRTLKQASFLDSVLGNLGLPRPVVLHLHVSRAGLVRRLTARRQCAECGSVYNLLSRPSLSGLRCEIDGGALVERADDTEGVILKRLADFESSCGPLIDYYAGADYRRVDGDRDPDVVAGELMRVVVRDEVGVPA
jgi:adenylate kinase